MIKESYTANPFNLWAFDPHPLSNLKLHLDAQFVKASQPFVTW
jgi:hypothetical protein